MFKTLIILYALNFWEIERTPNRGRSFPHWLASMIITITFFQCYYTHYFFQHIILIITFMAIKIFRIRRKIDKIAITYVCHSTYIQMVYDFRFRVWQPECIRIHPRQLLQQLFCKIQVVGVPPLGRHPQKTGV